MNPSFIVRRALDRFCRKASGEHPVIDIISSASYPSISFILNIFCCRGGSLSTICLISSMSLCVSVLWSSALGSAAFFVVAYSRCLRHSSRALFVSMVMASAAGLGWRAMSERMLHSFSITSCTKSSARLLSPVIARALFMRCRRIGIIFLVNVSMSISVTFLYK